MNPYDIEILADQWELEQDINELINKK